MEDRTIFLRWKSRPVIGGSQDPLLESILHGGKPRKELSHLEWTHR